MSDIFGIDGTLDTSLLNSGSPSKKNTMGGGKKKGGLRRD